MKLVIEDTIDDTRLSETLKAILENKDRVLIVYINSLGGSPLAGFALYELLRQCGKYVVTVAASQVYSAAMLPYLAGSRRYVHEYSNFLIHEVALISGESAAKPHILKQSHQELVDDSEKLFRLICQRSKLKMPRIKKALNKSVNRDWNFWAEDALKMGIATDIGWPMDEKFFSDPQQTTASNTGGKKSVGNKGGDSV